MFNRCLSNFSRTIAKPFSTGSMNPIKFPMIKDLNARPLLFRNYIDPERLKLEKTLENTEIVNLTNNILKNNPHGKISNLFFK